MIIKNAHTVDKRLDDTDSKVQLELVRFFVSMTKKGYSLESKVSANEKAEVVSEFSALDFSSDCAMFVESASEIISKAIVVSLDVIEKDYRRVRESAFQYAADFSANAVDSITARQKENIRRIISSGIASNKTTAQISRLIRDNIGLTSRQSDVLERYRQGLESDGLSPSKVDSRVTSRRNQMIRTRAKTIAVTELSQAKNVGKFIDWQERIESGTLSPQVKKKWKAGDACPICISLSKISPIPIFEEFRVIGQIKSWQHPPAHPNCKCSIVLVKQ